MKRRPCETAYRSHPSRWLALAPHDHFDAIGIPSRTRSPTPILKISDGPCPVIQGASSVDVTVTETKRLQILKKCVDLENELLEAHS